MQTTDVTPLGSILIEYQRALTGIFEKPFVDSMYRVARLLSQARERRATIYIAGNGGSASTASHWVNDLGKATKTSDRPPMRVMSLSDNVSWLTALANDEGYDRIFAGQMENFARQGDVLVMLSASGNSSNLVRAVELAKSRDVLTVALLGFDGGVLRTIVDEYLLIPTAKGSYGVVESGHSMICHLLTAILAND